MPPKLTVDKTEIRASRKFTGLHDHVSHDQSAPAVSAPKPVPAPEPVPEPSPPPVPEPAPVSAAASPAPTPEPGIAPAPPPPPPEGLSGFAFLCHSICADGPEPTPASSPPPPSTRKVAAPPGPLGANFVSDEDGLAICSKVKPESSVAGQLSPGDRILAINGTDTAQLNHDQLVALLTEQKDVERELAVASAWTA